MHDATTAGMLQPGIVPILPARAAPPLGVDAVSVYPPTISRYCSRSNLSWRTLQPEVALLRPQKTRRAGVARRPFQTAWCAPARDDGSGAETDALATDRDVRSGSACRG